MKIFEKMAAFIASPECVLEGYEVDFHKYDKQHLEQTIFQGMQYLWVVRRYGTHLVPVGLHPRNAEDIEAVISTAAMSGAHQCFEVSITTADGDGVLRQISVQQARDLAKVTRFAQGNGMIYHGSKAIAAVDCRLERKENRLTATVNYLSGEREPDAFERHVLKIISGNVATAEAQSFFVSVIDATLNRVSLFETENLAPAKDDLFAHAA